MLKMMTDLELFVTTVEEYKRFSSFLKINENVSLVDGYSEEEYIGIQVRLMLLRKYYGGKKENVSLYKVINDAVKCFPKKEVMFRQLLDRLELTEKEQMEHVLSDGTKLNLYDTIEDGVYGLYLHADQKRIERLTKTTEGIRVICTRKYILEIEKIVFAVYDILIECGVETLEPDIERHSPILRLESYDESKKITGSPYWKNLDGHDATQEDLSIIAAEMTSEEAKILQFCMIFFEELKKECPNICRLSKMVHPFSKRGWGDFTKVKAYVDSIPYPGFSSRVRYSEKRDIAYVRVHPNVQGEFTIDSPQIMQGVSEFALYKWFGKWKVYSFGGHLESVFVKK